MPARGRPGEGSFRSVARTPPGRDDAAEHGATGDRHRFAEVAKLRDDQPVDPAVVERHGENVTGPAAGGDFGDQRVGLLVACHDRYVCSDEIAGGASAPLTGGSGRDGGWLFSGADDCERDNAGGDQRHLGSGHGNIPFQTGMMPATAFTGQFLVAWRIVHAALATLDRYSSLTTCLLTLFAQKSVVIEVSWCDARRAVMA